MLVLCEFVLGVEFVVGMLLGGLIVIWLVVMVFDLVGEFVFVDVILLVL